MYKANNRNIRKRSEVVLQQFKQKKSMRNGDTMRLSFDR